MLRLWTEKTEGAEPRIPLRWCVDRLTVDKLKAIGRPVWLIITVVKDTYEQCRKVVPLDAMMEYLTFSSPGKHSIQAVVVADPEDEEAGYVKKRVLQSDSRWGQYQHRVVNNSGELDLSQIEIHSIEDSGSIEIEISKEFFAPEPPA